MCLYAGLAFHVSAEAIWYATGTKFSPGINQWESHLLNTRTETGLKSILDSVGISDGRDMWRAYGRGTAQKVKGAAKMQEERRVEGEQDFVLLTVPILQLELDFFLSQTVR